MKTGNMLNIALLDEDNFASSGMKALLDTTYTSVVEVNIFNSLNELIQFYPLCWDVIIVDANGVDFTLLEVFTWLDSIYECHGKRPKILFTHRYSIGQFPIAILEFYSNNIYNKEEGVAGFLQKINDMLSTNGSLGTVRLHITKSEKKILMELAMSQSINYLSRVSGKEKKTLYSHKNAALTKFGVVSSVHFLANYNCEQLIGLMKLSCFR